MSKPGLLYLIPTPIGDQDPRRILSPELIEIIGDIRHFIVESEKSVGRFLSRALPPEALAASTFSILDEHTGAAALPDLLKPALAGQDIGLISEAGCPCVADPGSELVAQAHRAGIRVVPLPGPSSILLALMASGFSGQSFLFLGYIPAQTAERKAALGRIEADCRRDGITRIFIETPYRNRAVLEDALQTLDGETRLCVAASLGGPVERVRSDPIRRWRETPFELGKEPSVFLVASKAAGAPPDRTGRTAPSASRRPAPRKKRFK